MNHHLHIVGTQIHQTPMKPNKKTKSQVSELDTQINEAVDIINVLKKTKDAKAVADLTKCRNAAVASLILSLEKHEPASTSPQVVASVLSTAADIAERNGKGQLYAEISSGKFLLDCLSFSAKHKFGNA